MAVCMIFTSFTGKVGSQSSSIYFAGSYFLSQNTLTVCQVTKEDKSFQNIMRCYRTQPQARSQVTTFSLRAEIKLKVFDKYEKLTTVDFEAFPQDTK